ncbi:hypothetical protein OB919_13240 [Halobacteria archaeon AArc-curdl1]|uniref:Uncharacterized protein n=1 Tax=Natronosalvus hydrolyticus TaxID=2979988 RepID=A0AAP2ZBH7_9EURY|nr:hypothetical protein [Halobacteria archaeon AArc-curdl1]
MFVLGQDESAVHTAMTLLNFTDDVDLLLNGREPEWDDETDELLRAHLIERVAPDVVGTEQTATSSADWPSRMTRNASTWAGPRCTE